MLFIFYCLNISFFASREFWGMRERHEIARLFGRAIGHTMCFEFVFCTWGWGQFGARALRYVLREGLSIVEYCTAFC